MKTLAGAALCLASGADAALSKCDVVSIIRAAGIPEAKVAAMTCTAFYESSWNPSATNHNTNGSTDYGLLQINNNYWCSDPSHPGAGNGCKTTCQALFDPTANAECAAIILRQQGITAWYGYRAHESTCNSYDISSCGGGGSSPSPGPAHDSTGSHGGASPTPATDTTGTGGGGASPTPGSDSTGTGAGSSPIPASDSTGTGGGSPAPASDTTGTGGHGGTTTTGGHGGTTTGGTGGGGGGGTTTGGTGGGGGGGTTTGGTGGGGGGGTTTGGTGGGGGGSTTGAAVSGRLSGKLNMKGLRK